MCFEKPAAKKTIKKHAKFGCARGTGLAPRPARTPRRPAPPLRAPEFGVFVFFCVKKKKCQIGRPGRREPPRSISFDEASRMVACFENPRRKQQKTPNSGARRGGASPTPRLHAPPAGPAPARTRIWRFFFLRKRQIPKKRPGSLSTSLGTTTQDKPVFSLRALN